MTTSETIDNFYQCCLACFKAPIIFRWSETGFTAMRMYLSPSEGAVLPASLR